jgi:hypothetical protein
VNDQTTPEEIDKWHRRFAVECNNLCWDLIEKTSRNEQDTERMLHAAHTAAFHWATIGTPLNVARADLTLSRAYAMAGIGDRALHYAELSWRFCETSPVKDWDTAFAHIAMAHAEALLGRPDGHARWYNSAQTAIAAIADDADREATQADLARVPKPRS